MEKAAVERIVEEGWFSACGKATLPTYILFLYYFCLSASFIIPLEMTSITDVFCLRVSLS